MRTLNEVGRTAEMRKYNLSMFGASERRWTGYGGLRTSTGETILFSGSEGRHEKGVALFPAKGLEKCLIEWKPVNERIIRGRFYGKQLNTTMIQLYAATDEADLEDKEDFYEQLSKSRKKYQGKIYLLLGPVGTEFRFGLRSWFSFFSRRTWSTHALTFCKLSPRSWWLQRK